MNILNTNGIALSATIGAGVRLASADIPSGGNPKEQKPISSNIWDRHISGHYHLGLNLHHGNNRQGHEGQAQHFDGGVPVSNSDDVKRSNIQTASTTEKPSFWERVRKYFTGSRSTEPSEPSEPDPNERNCTEGTPTSAGWLDCPDMTLGGNAFTRWYNRHFMKDEPRDQAQNRLLNTTNSSTESTVLSRITKFFAVYRFPAIFEQMSGAEKQEWRRDTEELRNTVRHFLADRISAYVTQNTTNSQFLQKMVRRSLLQSATNGTEEEVKHDKAATNTLASFFSIEKIRNLFPEIESLKQRIRSAQDLDSEKAYDSWFKQNFADIIAKYTTAKLKGPHLL